MTENTEPQPTVGRLTSLTPSIVPNDAADPELVAIGERYWALSGFYENSGAAAWCEKVKDIDTAGWGHQVHAIAAVGVRALLPDHKCPECGKVLSLTSRAAFQQVCDGENPTCVDCNASLQDAMRIVLDPARKAKRNAARARAEERQAVADACAEWHKMQRSIIARDHKVIFSEEDGTPPSAAIREQIATLALLRYAPSAAPIAEVSAWPDPLHPDSSEIPTLLASLVRSRLLVIAPSSPPSAFEWEHKSFEAALREAGGDLDAVPEPQLTDRFYPHDAHYYAPYGPSPGKAAERMDAHLSKALHPANMTKGHQEDLLKVAHELIAAEALRYFTHRLECLNLPRIPENHSARLDEVASKLAEHRSLGETYNLVWRVTQSAAATAQKNPRAPRSHMSTHAVNQLESHAQRVAAEPDWEIKSFSEIQGLGLAAMTRTLFFNILDSDPIRTSIDEVVQALPAPVDLAPTGQIWPPRDCDDDIAATVAWLQSRPERWNPDYTSKALDVFQARKLPFPEWELDGRLIARGAAHLDRLFERLMPAIGARHASLAVLAATAMLRHPLSVGDEEITNGEWLLAHLRDIVCGLADINEDADLQE